MFNKIYDVLSVFLKRIFCCFSLITLAMAIIGKSLNSGEISNYMSVDLIVSFFLFSALFAVSFGVADFFKNNSILRRFVQFVLTYACLYIVFIAGGAFESYVATNNIQNKAFSVLAISFAFVIIYAVCGAVAVLFSFIKLRLENKNNDYKEMFENK